MSALSKFKVQVFGASVDPPELNREFAEKGRYPFPLLSDPTKDYARALGALNPTTGFSQRWTYIIDDQGIIREIDKLVRPSTHGRDLAARLEALGIAKKEQ